LVVIAGPTGSGKSTLAVSLAADFSGEIVNCDSLQLYKGFDLGTAKLPESERRSIPHHMIDVLDANQGYSAGDYARETRRIIAEISSRGRIPFVTGGTGFYLRALLEGLPSLPPRNELLRESLAAREAKRPGSVHRILWRLDPATAARIHVRDTQKTIRALEIRLLTRRALPPVSTADPLTGFRVLKIGLDPDRTELYPILDARTRQMFRSGLVDEVRAMLGCLSGDEKPFESLGYRQALAYIRGAMTIEDAIASTQIETRQYAKRQWTWFRRDREFTWLRGFGHSPSVIEQSSEILRLYVRD
jgi:tRNA dimethylallyltransferase